MRRAHPNAGEYSGDYNELLYLRARYYAPETGRFLTKDTWLGDYNRPLSLSRWNYVEGNPVNYTDPSGHWIHPECQWMPTKGLYEACILSKYGLEPIKLFAMGETVTGERGCYSGPTQYRAPGYLEGIQWYKIAFVGGVTGGLETVYDFATMQRSSFSYIGGTLSDGLTGFGGGAYVGKVMGFRTDTTINDGYRGESITFQGGVSFDIVIGGAVGRGWFISSSDLRLGGKTLYLSGSVSGDLVEGIDLSGSIVNYKPTTDFVSYDVDRDGVVEKKAQLFSDIVSGKASPWGIPGYFISGPGVFLSRAYGRYLAKRMLPLMRS